MRQCTVLCGPPHVRLHLERGGVCRTARRMWGGTDTLPPNLAVQLIYGGREDDIYFDDLWLLVSFVAECSNCLVAVPVPFGP